MSPRLARMKEVRLPVFSGARLIRITGLPLGKKVKLPHYGHTYIYIYIY